MKTSTKTLKPFPCLFEAGSFEGAPLEVLRACDVAASSPVFLAQNQVP